MWDLHQNQEPVTQKEHKHPVLCVSFHPESSYFAGSSQDGIINIWDQRSHQLVQHYLEAHELGVTSISFHPQGSHMLSSSLDGTSKIWDLRQGRELLSFSTGPGRHKQGVTTSCFSACGTFIGTGTTGGQVTSYVWRGPPGEGPNPLDGGSSPMRGSQLGGAPPQTQTDCHQLAQQVHQLSRTVQKLEARLQMLEAAWKL